MSHVDGVAIMDVRTSTYELESTLPSVLCDEASRQGSWKQSYGEHDNTQHNSELLPDTQSSKKGRRVLESNARCSSINHNHQSKAAISQKLAMNSSKLSAQAIFKRVNYSQGMCKQFDSSDSSDVTDERDEPVGRCKVPASKNLMSERKRRKKLYEKLYSLRALVPNISKTLRNQVDKIQNDIVDLEPHKQRPSIVGSGEDDPRRRSSIAGCQKTIKQEHWIVELVVSQMEDHVYRLHIHCKKTTGVLVQLTRALEALELNILNANISSVDDHILNTVVVEVNDRPMMKSEDLRTMARAVMPKFGFSFC